MRGTMVRRLAAFALLASVAILYAACKPAATPPVDAAADSGWIEATVPSGFDAGPGGR
jgi:hypothetical protein